MCYSVAFVCDVLKSQLCIGGYSVLPAANLLGLGIIQARLSSALAEPQLCLCSFRIGVSVGIILLVLLVYSGW